MADIHVPCIRPINFSECSSVTIKGQPTMSFSMNPQLQVDFHTGPDKNSDIAFHFRVHFGDCVVMNSRDCGGWRYEVKSLDMPFQDGQPFELRFVVLQNEYQVLVNGEHWYSFSHRFDPKSVKMMQIWRDVSLSLVDICDKGM